MNQSAGDQRCCRRGAALLVVLGVLLVSTTAATILLATAANVRAHRQLAHSESIAFDVLHASEAPIQHWLESKSSKVVLPPDVVVPAVPVLNDRWVSAEDTIELVITAFDQLGMAPLQVARSGSPLRLALPMEVAMLVDRLDLPPPSEPTPLGLDIVTPAIMAVDEDTSTVAVFPQVPMGGRGRGQADIAVGGLVATHNREPIRININTSPRPLLEAALRAGGRGGLDSILASRSEGTIAVVAEEDQTPARNSETGNEILAPQLVTVSDSWSFRIDITIGRLKRSWWNVYQPGPDDPETPQQERWRCVQRLPIDR